MQGRGRAGIVENPGLLTYRLSEKAVAFSTMRQPGCGRGKYYAFNINRHCGDNPESVDTNRKALCAMLGVRESRLLYPHQVHGTRGIVVDERLAGLPQAERERELDGFDHISTQLPGVCIGVSTADCVPVLICGEHETPAVAAVHAGWRGTLNRIAYKAVKDAEKNFGMDAAKLKAVIGPSISLDAFEVGEEVYSAFNDAGFDMGAIAARMCGKWHIDLWKANANQLVEAGVPHENISVAGICTYSDYGNFFSARRLGIKSGRIFSGIMIR